MIDKIINFLQGYLLISIRGNALERFVDQIINNGIVLRNLERVNKNFYRAEIGIEDFKKLRPLVKKRLCQVKIIKKIGLPFLLRKARIKGFLLFGFIIFILIFWLGSSYLWFIEIEGLNHINNYNIKNKLQSYGIQPGVKKERINLSKLENKLLSEFTDIVWINAQWQGTRLFIDIVEKKKIEKTDGYDIVAQKDGVIKELIVLNGEPVVQEGDTITKGEKLIIGITNKNGKKQKARGIVNAEIWYNVSGNAAIVDKEYIFTGKKKNRYGFNINQTSLLLPPNKINFTNYIKKITSKELLKWRKFDITLELIKEENIEFKSYKIVRSKESSLYHAKKKALSSLLEKMNSGSSIKSVYIDDFHYNKNNKTIDLSLMVKTEENIASKEEDFSG